MSYKTFLSRTKIKPDITSATIAHRHIYEELSKGKMNPEVRRRFFTRILMSMWCRYSSMARKWHRPLADWIIEDCERAMLVKQP